MKGLGIITLLIMLGTIVSAIGSYIVGRIMLPGMGLTVPSFGAFLAASFVTLVTVGVSHAIRAGIGD